MNQELGVPHIVPRPIDTKRAACSIATSAEFWMEQGRIHGHQLRTGGQERKCAFLHFSTRAHQRTDGPTNRRTVKASFRVACPRLKIEQVANEIDFSWKTQQI